MLTKRLETVGALVDKNDKIADIGTDHAYLPILLIENGTIQNAVASDIGAGPTQNARENVAKYGFENQISVRLGAGLEPLAVDEGIETVIIAGMGGKLISEILEDGWQANRRFAKLILEPNVGEQIVRQWLIDHQYEIVAERIMAEEGHTYEIIKAVQSSKNISLTADELLFGPFLLKEKNEIFKQKWSKQISFYENLLDNLKKAKQPDEAKIRQINRDLNAIKEVLK